MILIVLLWNFFALIGLISFIVLQQKPSIKEIISEKSKKPVSIKASLKTELSTMSTQNVTLMSDSMSDESDTGNSKDAMNDCSGGGEIDKNVEGLKEPLNYENALHGMSGEKIIKPLKDLELDAFRLAIDYKGLNQEMNQKGILLGLNEFINHSFKDWAKMKLDIALTGNSGTGKSSLINALRKLNPSDEGAAAVDVVEATCRECKYTYPENPNVALWDLPGIGTQNFTKEKYLANMNFRIYDVVIIVSACRFLENDIWLGQKVRELHKNVIFVRTKIDIDLMNDKRDHPDTFTEKGCLEKIRRNLYSNIRDGGEEKVFSGVYLVSSPERDSYDFPDLKTSLKEMLNIKGEAIRTLLQHHADGATKAYQESNKKEFTFRKVASVVYGFLPIPYIETIFGNLSVSRIRDICLKKFCIDESSLEVMAKALQRTKPDLKKSLKHYKIRQFDESVTDVIEEKNWPSIQERYSKYIFPIFGSFYSAYKTYKTTDMSLETITDEMANDECFLINLRLNRLKEDLERKLPM